MLKNWIQFLPSKESRESRESREVKEKPNYKITKKKWKRI